MDANAEIVPFGDRALRFPIPPSIDRRGLFFALRALAGVIDVVLAEDTGMVVLLPNAPPSAPSLARALALASAPAPGSALAPAPAHHTIRVLYDGEDLPLIAAATHLSIDDVIALHADHEYEVTMLGFLPGFAYLRGLDPRLLIPRRAQPRTRVPAGSVAIAAEYTGIYPFASPGGWNLLGRVVAHRAFGPAGAALAIGDRVRFVRDAGTPPIAGVGFEDAAPLPLPSPSRSGTAPRAAHLEVRKALGPAIVVDGGRIGHMHEGVPHGGAMAPRRLARANRVVRNAPGAAAVEIYGVLEVVARGGSVEVGDDAGVRRVLADGEAFVVATEGRSRVRYLAVRGGIDVPVVLDGRGTLLVASMGGHEGRPLRRGDVVMTTANIDVDADVDVNLNVDVDVPIVDGPDADENVLDAVCRATFTISAQSDRIGTRLDGPPLPAHSMHDARDRARSRPMIAGAIELTPSGLVVLGPDHPTTGGYPVLAVVREASLGALLARPIGARVSFARTASTPT